MFSFHAKSQQEGWAKEGPYSAIASDNQGNLLTVSGNTLIKFDTTGSIVWSQVYGANVSNLSNAKDSSIFITGSFLNTITLGTFTLTATGSTSVFLAKLNSLGIVQWAKKINNDLATLKVVADTKGNSYVGGYGSPDNIIINSFSASGDYRFTKTIPINYFASNTLTSISTDKSDNLHV
ncbi:MAG TPA: hypothetical protein VM935_10440, partial [Chitinophagaceae bacterium]|nr:hypothetical protein [Chitinophagaceae bacterium]